MLKPKVLLQVVILVLGAGLVSASADESADYLGAVWNPIHFQPQIQRATNEQCLACHKEVLEDRPLAQSPAGVKADESLAWYQTLSAYQGEQESFHRRHMVTPLAQRLMKMRCSTCHQGHDLREEAPIPPDTVSRGASGTPEITGKGPLALNA